MPEWASERAARRVPPASANRRFQEHEMRRSLPLSAGAPLPSPSANAAPQNLPGVDADADTCGGSELSERLDFVRLHSDKEGGVLALTRL